MVSEPTPHNLFWIFFVNLTGLRFKKKKENSPCVCTFCISQQCGLICQTFSLFKRTTACLHLLCETPFLLSLRVQFFSFVRQTRITIFLSPQTVSFSLLSLHFLSSTGLPSLSYSNTDRAKSLLFASLFSKCKIFALALSYFVILSLVPPIASSSLNKWFSLLPSCLLSLLLYLKIKKGLLIFVFAVIYSLVHTTTLFIYLPYDQSPPKGKKTFDQTTWISLLLPL